MSRVNDSYNAVDCIVHLANRLQTWGDGIIHGMTMKQFFLLQFISRVEKVNPTIKEVADSTGTTRQNVKKLLEQLETKGYLKIEKSQADARALTVSLTEAAHSCIAENDRKSKEAISELFSEVSDIELRVSLQVLNGVLEALENAAGADRN